MFKLPKETRDTLVNYLASSSLPYRDVAQILKALNELQEIKEEPKEDGK